MIFNIFLPVTTELISFFPSIVGAPTQLDQAATLAQMVVTLVTITTGTWAKPPATGPMLPIPSTVYYGPSKERTRPIGN